MAVRALQQRHIQDHNEAGTHEVPHWGYAGRVLPCTSDAGTCEYLDAVYRMHDTSMLYNFILWGVLLGIVVAWVTIRGWRMGGPIQSIDSTLDKLCDSVSRAKRRWLLPDAPLKRLFGRVSRLQVAVLACLLAYLLVFSLVGITYKTWITPVEDMPGVHNTRTGLGGWSDRVGALAYALTPFTILLSSRESVLSLLTGVPYQHFNFLHRWLGRIMFAQAFLHTLGWTIIEGKLYQPQPVVYTEFMNQMYIIFGVVAMFLLTLMLLLSTQTAIKRFGYEFFKITHWIIAILYIAACWGHWDRLWCWMVASLALIAIDQAMRMLRALYIHMGGSKTGRFGFQCAQAEVTVFGKGNDGVVRLDFNYEHRQVWQPGQHFHICFPSLSIWQSHPFTPVSSPYPSTRMQHHTYIMRARSGLTAILAKFTKFQTMPVILTGPYGRGYPHYETNNVLAIAGGTGVTFTLPVARAALEQPFVAHPLVDFVWIVRTSQDLVWLVGEIVSLIDLLEKHNGLKIDLYVTRQDHVTKTGCNSSSLERYLNEAPGSGEHQWNDILQRSHPRLNITFLDGRHPAAPELLQNFMDRAESNGGNIEIVGSGPEALDSDLRSAVAEVKMSEAVGFYWDSRE